MQLEDLLKYTTLESVELETFVLNALLVVVLTWILSWFYERYGRAVSNRSQFSHNFMLLALTTMLIIYIVKSSIALSLGLVGALSIVRFRAAIKEPEELTYLFLVIGIGLGMGAGQALITTVAFVLILAFLFFRERLGKKNPSSLQNMMLVSLTSKSMSEVDINQCMERHFKKLDLRRMSKDKENLFLTYQVEVSTMDQLSAVKTELSSQDENIEFSFVDNSAVVS